MQKWRVAMESNLEDAAQVVAMFRVSKSGPLLGRPGDENTILSF